MEELSKTYDSKEVESKIYQQWLEKKAFKPEVNPDGDPFCIIMPPPNANGSLHVGHAVGITVQDIMTRFARMNGKAALWLPGADHAGFETQVVFEKKLEKDGRSRFQMPREELYQETLAFTLENKKNMENQTKKMGASCDWDREKFTLDEDVKKIVYENFKKLYDDGLAYRALRLVNWCPKHQTSLSDLEVKYEERTDSLYYIKYGPLTVATTRPETMFADVAVAVNPADKRFKDLIGTQVPLPLTERTIPVIADEAVDMKFGTGAVKITPAHDPVDFEIGQKHDLELFSILDDRARMILDPRAKILADVQTELKDKKAAEAREITVKLLSDQGLMEKIDDKYNHTVGKCYKCGNIIEPMPREQWYIAVNKTGKSGKNLAKDALKAVADGKVKFVTPKFEKIFKHWMKNIRDWNISRQIVWGIQIPAWYKGDEITVGEKPEGEGWIQDNDVFDTWFSSGQWPFVTLMTTGAEGDFKKFYPTKVMETAWDILFFWVARMIMLGLYATGEVPFENVYIHGLVRDKDRQKMSKSKGNVMDPLGVTELYGTDAVRMALVFGTSAGNDVIISEDKIRGMRNFANKVWNVSRFILMNLDSGYQPAKPEGTTEKDKWILEEMSKTKKEVTRFIESYRFSQAGEVAYEFVWHKFADIYIEEAKNQLQDNKLKANTQNILIEVLSESLKMLHPFMPFITEEIWSKLPDREKMLIITKW